MCSWLFDEYFLFWNIGNMLEKLLGPTKPVHLYFIPSILLFYIQQAVDQFILVSHEDNFYIYDYLILNGWLYGA
jgi:hypothetical protein